jgi:hypothetical protein
MCGTKAAVVCKSEEELVSLDWNFPSGGILSWDPVTYLSGGPLDYDVFPAIQSLHRGQCISVQLASICGKAPHRRDEVLQ